MMSVTTIAKGDGSGITTARRVVVRTGEEWRALWAAHAGPSAEAPSVDFGTQMVVAAFAGERPTPGFGVEIAGIRRDGQTLAFVVNEYRPAPGMLAAQVIVTPFHIVAIPRFDGEISFVDASGAHLRQDAAAAEAVPLSSGSAGLKAESTRASSTGLDPNTAAALAYLAGPFSGFLILLIERANGYVRFHAWQAVVGLGGLGLLAAGMLALSFLTLLLSPFLFTVMYRLSYLLATVWVVVWIICLVKAVTGNRWMMPVAGRHAERLATRPA